MIVKDQASNFTDISNSLVNLFFGQLSFLFPSKNQETVGEIKSKPNKICLKFSEFTAVNCIHLNMDAWNQNSHYNCFTDRPRHFI